MSKLFVTMLFAASALVGYSQNYSVDAGHSRLGFAIFHNSLAEFHGNFNGYEANITKNGKTFEGATIAVKIDVNTVNTGIEARDNHLKSADFFTVETYPTINFQSKPWVKTGDNTFKVMGDLTIKGITKPVTLEVVLTGEGVNPRSNAAMAGFKMTGSFNRSDFDLGPEFGSVGDEAKLVAFGEFAQK